MESDSPTLELFTCQALAARVTTRGCATLWSSGEKHPPRPDESRARCIGCETGARNAGVDVEAARRAARASELAGICVTCTRGGGRLIRGRHCVSCYNRQREVSRGMDARGRAPRFAARYGTVTLLVGSGADPASQSFHMVTGLPEAILTAAKLSNGAAIQVGWRRLSPLPPGGMLDLAPAFAPQRGVRRRRPRGPSCRQPADAIAQLSLPLLHA